MDETDRVFARFKDHEPEPPDGRETLSIPRRNGASGSRTVEVVHLRSGGATKDRPQRLDTQVRAASWDDGFPANKAAASPVFAAPAAAQPAPPGAHVLSAWTPAVAEAPPTPLSTEAPVATEPRRRGRPRKQIATTPPTRHVADPFDASDDGANRMRCGYLVRQRADRRSLQAPAAPGRGDRISGTLGEPSAGGSTQGLFPPKKGDFRMQRAWPADVAERRLRDAGLVRDRCLELNAAARPDDPSPFNAFRLRPTTAGLALAPRAMDSGRSPTAFARLCRRSQRTSPRNG